MKFFLKIFFALIILTLNSTIAFSQNADSVLSANNNQSKFSIGVFGTALYDYQLISVDRDPSQFEYNWAKSKEEGEKARFGYSTGVGVLYAISKKISIECDLLYSVKGTQMDVDDFTFGDMTDPRFGFIY